MSVWVNSFLQCLQSTIQRAGMFGKIQCSVYPIQYSPVLAHAGPDCQAELNISGGISLQLSMELPPTH